MSTVLSQLLPGKDYFDLAPSAPSSRRHLGSLSYVQLEWIEALEDILKQKYMKIKARHIGD
jgi:hypothetical protein